MVNLLLTTYCNNNCPYCFAKQKVDLGKDYKAKPDEEITLENVRYVIDFFKDVKYMGLLGGEPTLHPKFKEIVNMFLDAGYRVNVFTNGRFSEDILDFLKKAPRTSLLFNINEPKFYYPREEYDKIVKHVIELAKAKPNQVSVGINFFYLQQDYHYIIDIAKRANVKRIRFDIAHPIVNEKNLTIPIEKYPEMGKKLAQFADEAWEYGIELSADCGATIWCMFDEESRKKLFRARVGRLFETCVNGGAIDVGPDLTVWRCFPLSRFLNKKLYEFKNLRDIQKYFNKKYSYFFFNFYPMDKCYDCKYAINKQCIGSCLSRTIEVFQQREKKFFKNYYAPILRDLESKGLRSLFLVNYPELKAYSNVKVARNIDDINSLNIDVIFTDYFQNFNPLDFTLFKISKIIVPSVVQAFGVFLNTKKPTEIKRWRKTKNVSKEKFLHDSILIYSTDLKKLDLKQTKFKVPNDANAFLIYYIAKFNNYEFNSLHPDGFQWLFPLPNDLREVDLSKYLKVKHV